MLRRWWRWLVWWFKQSELDEWYYNGPPPNDFCEQLYKDVSRQYLEERDAD